MGAENWEEGIRGLLMGSRLQSVSRTLDVLEMHLTPTAGDMVHFHLQCPCRVRRRDVVFLGSGDLVSGSGHSYFDSRVAAFNDALARTNLTVIDVRFGSAGACEVVFVDDFGVEILPDTGRKVEAWRVFRSGDADQHWGYPFDLI